VDILQALTLGTSFYWSGGDAVPTRAVGDGSPKGGVINWMEKDQFAVFGGYAQLQLDSLLVQAEGWASPHQGVRDEASVLALADAGLNKRQLERYFVGGNPANGTTALTAEYLVATAYVRAGYDFKLTESASIVPYAQFDWYSNPETIRSKDFGGDGDEAGLSDDGVFYKVTAGAVFRPVPPIALKVDSSVHILQVNDSLDYYPELRVSFSYLWELPTVSIQ
jgi:hypothetical protein